MKKWKGCLLMAAVLLSSLICVKEVQAAKQETVYQGVFINEADVSGMTEAEVRTVVEQLVAERGKTEITLHMNGNTHTTTAQALGYTWTNDSLVQQALEYGKRGNVVTRYMQKKDLQQNSAALNIEGVVDAGAVQSVLETNCIAFNQEAVDYSIDVIDGEITQIPGTIGVALDVPNSVTVISEQINETWQGTPVDIDLAVITTQPGGDQESLSKVTDKMGAGSTDYSSSSSNRKANVANAVSKIDGTILYPGESFSVLDAVLPFTTENGYEAAGSYVQGEVVESIGGGVCQVSTTLYLALIRAELQVDTRYNHSMLISYVKPAFDAAVAEGSKDLEFTNNTDAPIYIHGTADGYTVAFTIFGMDTRSEDREIEFKSVTVEDSNPKVKVHAELWKYVTEGGETTKTRMNSSVYYKSNSENDAEAARPVIEMIGAIGEVTLDDEGAIAAAEAAYNALTASQQEKVTNIGVLRDARAVLDQAKAAQAAQAEAESQQQQ